MRQASKEDRRGLVWSQIGIGVAAAMAGQQTLNYHGSIRVNNERTNYSGTIHYTDRYEQQRVARQLSESRGQGLSKKMAHQFEINQCNTDDYYNSFTK